MVNKILKIGITGGIGGGKTTACKIFESLGVPVYYADERAKLLMKTDASIRENLISLFGQSAYNDDGDLNNKLIAEIVFRNPARLKKLNSIVHPAVFKDSEIWHKNQNGVPYTLKEAALLFESGSHHYLDKIIVITAPENLRIARVMARDNSSYEDVLARIKSQLPEQIKIKLADFIIDNDGSKSLIKQVWKVHREILKIAKRLDTE